MKRITIIASLLICSFFAKGQEVRSGNAISEESQDVGQKVVVNMKMIQNFQDYRPQGEYVSFFDVYMDLKSEERFSFFSEYSLSDLNSESLSDIKARVQQNLASISFSQEEIEKFSEIKKEINYRLTNESQARLRIEI